MTGSDCFRFRLIPGIDSSPQGSGVLDNRRVSMATVRPPLVRDKPRLLLRRSVSLILRLRLLLSFSSELLMDRRSSDTHQKLLDTVVVDRHHSSCRLCPHCRCHLLAGFRSQFCRRASPTLTRGHNTGLMVLTAPPVSLRGRRQDRFLLHAALGARYRKYLWPVSSCLC